MKHYSLFPTARKSGAPSPPMTSPDSPPSLMKVLIGIAIPIATALLIAAGRAYHASKLDTVRYEKDSIARAFDQRDIVRGLTRLDSGQARIERKVDALAAETRHRR